MNGPNAHCAVLDVGKTHVKLLVLDDAGTLLHQASRRNAPVDSGLGYPALDTAGIETWLLDELAALGPLRARLRQIVPVTHGAAFAPMTGAGPAATLALPVPDYEFDGYTQAQPGSADWASLVDPFADTLSPVLPGGLNAARQWRWLQQTQPQRWAQVGALLPYPQYWAQRLTGQGVAEVSSLGCHTQAWQPLAGEPSALARRQGWAPRLPPLRRAWEVLGTLRNGLARQLGLPADCVVHVGAHDSNACLAAYLRSMPQMTLVSTGTWTVIMASGGQTCGLDAARDMLANVNVRGEAVPTARFMGGRELQTLCAGADPALADTALLPGLAARGVLALPAFSHQGGPFGTLNGQVLEGDQPLPPNRWTEVLSPAERATLAAAYCAQVSAWLIEHLRGPAPVVVDGPFAHNPVYLRMLSAALGGAAVAANADALEGTARGGWLLGRWTGLRLPAPALRPVDPDPVLDPLLRAWHARWLDALADASP